MLNTPVALFIFNRPDTTARVFAVVAQVRPARLFIVADGPRPDRPDDARQCQAARAVVEQIDWPCQVQRNYAETNLGCGRRMVSGLDWVFDSVEEAIILEDDCLPDPTFFPFCEELLGRYRDDHRIMMISGDRFPFGRRCPFSYSFSRFTFIWGWASWRRAWRHYDARIGRWPALRPTAWLAEAVAEPAALPYWQDAFDRTHAGLIDTWDYQWTFACWLQQGLAVVPDRNLVSNIGFRQDATHTRSDGHPLAALPVSGMPFPLRHPPEVGRDLETDRALARGIFAPGVRPAEPILRAWGRRLGKAIGAGRWMRRVRQWTCRPA